jgi:hypothetical protein
MEKMLEALAGAMAASLLSNQERTLTGAAIAELSRGPFGSREGSAMATRVLNEARTVVVTRMFDALAGAVLQKLLQGPSAAGRG